METAYIAKEELRIEEEYDEFNVENQEVSWFELRLHM